MIATAGFISPLIGVIKWVRDPHVAPNAIVPDLSGVYHIGSNVNMEEVVIKLNELSAKKETR